MTVSSFLASVSQIMLKKSALKKHSKRLFEYLNIWVISGYGLLCLSMLLNIIAYRGVNYQTGIIMGALPYVFVIILEKAFLNKNKYEKSCWNKFDCNGNHNICAIKYV